MFSSVSVFQLIAMHTTDLVCLHDGDNSIRFATPSSKDILGYPADHLLGKKLTDFLSEQFINEMDFNTLMRFFEQPGARIRYQIKHFSGKLRWLETTYTILEPGMNYRSLSTTRDITESVHLTDDLMQALSKEQELSKFKTNLYSIASHEFKTPLAIIQANIEMLKIKQSPKLLSSGLATMEEEVDRLNDMIMDMLELKRLTMGRRNCNTTEVDVKALITELFEVYRNEEKNYHLELIVEGNEPYEIQADYSLMRYVFTNLIGNSIKFSNNLVQVKVLLNYQDKALEILVQDQGIGIPEDDQTRIFQSFYRGSNVGNISGTGVGLSIVAEFVNLHKGKIKLQSEVGNGSTFTITLPKT
jgi:PAS domain S-box-containing protein